MDNVFNFQKLTPIDNANLSIYKDTLDFVFENSDIKNIGISGAYSAGKSSIIETYKKSKPEIKFMHISLAYFQSPSDFDKQTIEQKENILEGKILNQLIHQIEPDDIPQTNFRVKRQLSSKRIWISTAMIILLVTLLIYLFNFRNWSDFVTAITPKFIMKWLLWSTTPLTAILSGIACIGIFTYLIHEILKVQFNKNLFKGISVQGNTIEIFEQSDESYFDKYLNEVLYLFENSGKDAIVFEDMDRYNTNQIFQRLREINTLINNRKKNTEKPLRFFYLLRDDIFVSKDRTKFFDFIMPVIPIVDSSNSFDQFIEHFKQGNIYNLFSEQFLQEISLYIDDMRILKNIYNEFLVYYKRISTTEQDPNKLLAMIIYKNIFPRDFSELQLNRGFVHTLFDKKDVFINDEINEQKQIIKKLNTDLENAEKENLLSNEEVDLIYDPQIKDLQYYYSRSNELQDLQNEKAARKENIKNKTVERQSEIKKKIALVENIIIELKHKKLKEVINKQNIDNIFKVKYINEIGQSSDFNNIKGSEYFPLIKYLIRNGYIDETYPDYMTYFYENILSRADKIFLRSITDEEAKDYSYQLKNPEKIVDKLSDISFEKEETLNFDLLSYLLVNQTQNNQSKISKMLYQLKNNQNFEFINFYMESGRSMAPFIKALNHVWPSVFGEILAESDFSEERIKQYALESIYNTDNADLEELDSNNVLSSYISSHKNFLDIAEPNIQRIVDTFQSINVKFEDINYETSNKELFRVVYQNNFYVISYDLICLMLKNIYGCSNDERLKHQNYTLILSKIEEPLVKYVQENINDYVIEILEHCNGYIADTEETVINILNEEALKEEYKIKYIDNLTTKINNLTDIRESSLWQELMGCELVVYSENNVLCYFFNDENGMDKILAHFINLKGNSFNYNYNRIDEIFGKGNASKFLNAVVKSEHLEIKSYENILKSMNMFYPSFNITGIVDSKVDVLINQKIIRMNANVLIFMRENYPNKVIRFIESNIQLYTEIISIENVITGEILDVLETKIDDKYKISLLKYVDEPISAINDAYSDEIKKYVLTNNFDITDIPKLLKKYNFFTDKLQILIDTIVINNIDDIIDNEYSVPIQLCRKLFVRESLDRKIKLQIFAISVYNFNEDECKEGLEILNQRKILSAFFGKRPTIPITNTNKKILDVLVSKRWIVGYSEDKKQENMYRISSKRIMKQKPLPIEML